MNCEIKNFNEAERLATICKNGHITQLPDGRVFYVFDDFKDGVK